MELIKNTKSNNKEYVIKTQRLANWLYYLGFNYRNVIDKTGRQEYIYLFNDTEELHKAITFWNEFRKGGMCQQISD